jgi:very-short-patch-repair endonuclease
MDAQKFVDVLRKKGIDAFVRKSSGREEAWVKVTSICSYLGLTNGRASTSTFDSTEKKTFLAPDSRNTEKNISYLSQKGVHRLVCQSRKLQAIELATALGIQHVIKLIPEEATFVQIIQSCFQGERILLQHRVDNYIMDIYFPEHRIAVEYDENAHRSRIIEDREREIYIRNKLGCIFVRATTDTPIYSVINSIYTIMKRSLLARIEKLQEDNMYLYEKGIKFGSALKEHVLEQCQTNIPALSSNIPSTSSNGPPSSSNISSSSSNIPSTSSNIQPSSSDIQPVASPSIQPLTVPPLPPTFTCMKDFYNTWKLHFKPLYDQYKERFGRIHWAQLYEKKNAKLYAQRYSHVLPWLEYIEQLDEATRENALNVMAQFAKDNSIPHSVCIKKVFHQIVKPELLLDSRYHGFSSKLGQALQDANLPMPQPKSKQDHSKRMQTFIK